METNVISTQGLGLRPGRDRQEHEGGSGQKRRQGQPPASDQRASGPGDANPFDNISERLGAALHGYLDEPGFNFSM